MDSYGILFCLEEDKDELECFFIINLLFIVLDYIKMF